MLNKIFKKYQFKFFDHNEFKLFQTTTNLASIMTVKSNRIFSKFVPPFLTVVVVAVVVVDAVVVGVASVAFPVVVSTVVVVTFLTIVKTCCKNFK
jgi:hypothetical protein